MALSKDIKQKREELDSFWIHPTVEDMLHWYIDAEFMEAEILKLKDIIAKATGHDGHWSDCATHNEPAYPNGPCDCGGNAPLAHNT